MRRSRWQEVNRGNQRFAFCAGIHPRARGIRRAGAVADARLSPADDGGGGVELGGNFHRHFVAGQGAVGYKTKN